MGEIRIYNSIGPIRGEGYYGSLIRAVWRCKCSRTGKDGQPKPIFKTHYSLKDIIPGI